MLYLEGLTTLEVGDVLGITEGNAAVRLRRLRQWLEAKLQQVKQTLQVQDARARGTDGGVARTFAEWLPPIPRRARQLRDLVPFPGTAEPLLAARLETAQSEGPTARGAGHSIVQPLAPPTPTRASLSRRAL